MLRKRRLIAFVCVVALVMAAMAPVASAIHYAVLELVDPLFALAVIPEVLAVVSICPVASPSLAPTSSRPPPSL